jgi:hypothetical protein
LCVFVEIFINRYVFISICVYIGYAKDTYYARKDYPIIGKN